MGRRKGRQAEPAGKVSRGKARVLKRCLLWVPLGAVVAGGIWLGAHFYVAGWGRRLERERTGAALPAPAAGNKTNSLLASVERKEAEDRWRDFDRIVHLISRELARRWESTDRAPSFPLSPPSPEERKRYDLAINLGFWGLYGALVGLCVGAFGGMRFGGKLALLTAALYVPAHLGSFLVMTMWTTGPTASGVYRWVRPWGLIEGLLAPPWVPAVGGAEFSLEGLLLNLLAAVAGMWLVGTVLAAPFRLAARSAAAENQ